jgi:hypothetical protein
MKQLKLTLLEKNISYTAEYENHALPEITCLKQLATTRLSNSIFWFYDNDDFLTISGYEAFPGLSHYDELLCEKVAVIIDTSGNTLFDVNSGLTVIR